MASAICWPCTWSRCPRSSTASSRWSRPACARPRSACAAGRRCTSTVDLVQHVAANWNAHGVRAHARLGGGYVLDTVLGLHDLHCALGRAARISRTSCERSVTGGPAISLSEATAVPRRVGVGGSTAQRALAGARARSGSRRLPHPVGACRGRRQRARAGGGTGRPGVARAGGRRASPDWMVGVIRWLRIDEQGQVDAGIELLARRALAVGARALDGVGVRRVVRGVLLAPLAATPGAHYDALLASTEIEREVRDGRADPPGRRAGCAGAGTHARTCAICACWRRPASINISPCRPAPPRAASLAGA